MKIKKMGGHNLPIPAQKTSGSAGYDLQAVDDVIIGNNEQAIISTGYAFDLPDLSVGIIKDRSSLAMRGLCVLGGVIDCDYTGEIKVIIRNLGSTYAIKSGDRIAQLVVTNYIKSDLTLVDNLDNTNRGDNGFGSTGK